MGIRLSIAILAVLTSAPIKAAILLDSINITFTEKNAFLAYNPTTTGGSTQYAQYGEVAIDRSFQIPPGYRLDSLQFAFQQTGVSISALPGGWSLSNTVINVSASDPSRYGGGTITWRGPPSFYEIDYPGGNAPSPSIKTVDYQSNASLVFALSGLINSTADPSIPFSAVAPSISHEFYFTSPATITSAVFSYRLDLYDTTLSVPLPPSVWLFGGAISVLNSLAFCYRGKSS